MKMDRDKLLKELEQKVYLGDGVYAQFDGYHIALMVEGDPERQPQTIWLDPDTRTALKRYDEKIDDLCRQLAENEKE